jgi:hypothetical protein
MTIQSPHLDEIEASLRQAETGNIVHYIKIGRRYEYKIRLRL